VNVKLTNKQGTPLLDQIDPVFGWLAISILPDRLQEIGLPRNYLCTAGEVDESIQRAIIKAIK